MNFDLIVIGGGPAGYLAAERAGNEGMNTLLVEKRALGGVCLNEGCIPSKTLLYSAKLYDQAIHSQKYGVTVENAFFNHEMVINRKNKVVRAMTAGVKAKLKKSNVTFIMGKAEILGKCDDGFIIRIEDIVYHGIHLLIASGAVPVLPPIAGIQHGIDSGFVLTNREIFDLKEVPASLVIAGGGVIGLEMASYFNSAGSKVTVIEMLDHIAGSADREIAGILMKNFIKKGTQFKLSAKVTEIQEGLFSPETGQMNNIVTYLTEGQTYSIAADKLLISVGRKPVTEGFGLDLIGVVTEQGHIPTDEYGRTNIPGVYAAGDVNGISMLAHTAYREAEVCIQHMLGKSDQMKYHAIPSVIYTNPEMAGVGETEETASKKGLEFEAATLPMMYSGRYAAENEGGDGICKVLVEKGSRKILGVHLIGNYSSEIIYGAGLMIEKEMCADEIKQLVFPHPTISEIIRETIFET